MITNALDPKPKSHRSDVPPDTSRNVLYVPRHRRPVPPATLPARLLGR